MIRIFTNFKGDNDNNWKPFVDYISPPNFLFQTKIPRFSAFLGDFIYALKLYFCASKYDLALLAGSRSGNIFAVLNSLLPFHTIPVVMFSNLWEIHRIKFQYYLKRLQIKVMDRCIIKYLLNSSADILPYCKAFSLSPSKFQCLPYFTTLWKYRYVVKDKAYVFSGGNGQRDYRPLIQVAKELPHQFVIATSNYNAFQRNELPANVKIMRVSHDRFRELMAEARIHVVCMAGGYLRSGGHQTYLNGMLMGKPVIVTDTAGTKEYISHGVDGYVVEPTDLQQLKDTIDLLMNNQDLREAVGSKASFKAGNFNGSNYLKNLINIAKGAYFERKTT